MIDDIKTPPMDDELKNYIERHRNWQNFALGQFSFTNNLLLTISLGFLAYLFEKVKGNQPNTIPWLYGLSLFFILSSIFEGIIVAISRLYDFRISRHVAYVRMRYYKKKKENEKGILPDSDFRWPNFFTRINAICKVIFCRVEFLTQNEIKKLNQESYKEKFNSFRELSNTLGIISWKGLKWQAAFLLFSCICYALSIALKNYTF